MPGPRWTVPGYTHVRELEHGPRGEVVLATHDETGRQVAIEYRLDGRLADAERLGRLDDPHVLRLHGYLETPWGTAIVREHAPGVSLRDILREHGPMAPEPALWVLLGSLRGLAAGHRLGAPHGDFRPENVLVTPDGEVKLRDFGVAAAASGAAADIAAAGYLAPQRWQGAPASPDADVYGATATFVEALTGRPPYPVGSPRQARRRHERAAIPVEALPAPVRELVQRGLAKDLADRPPNAGVLLVELDAAAPQGYGEDWQERGRSQLARRAALAGLLPAAVPARPDAGTGADDLARHRRAAVALAGVAALLLVGGVVAVGQLGGLPGGTAASRAPEEAPAVPAGPPGAVAPPGPPGVPAPAGLEPARPAPDAPRAGASGGVPPGPRLPVGPLLGSSGAAGVLLPRTATLPGPIGPVVKVVRESPPAAPLPLARQARPVPRPAAGGPADGSSAGPQTRSAPPSPPARGLAAHRDGGVSERQRRLSAERDQDDRHRGEGDRGERHRDNRDRGEPGAGQPRRMASERGEHGEHGARGEHAERGERGSAVPRSKPSRDASGHQGRSEGRDRGGHGSGSNRGSKRG